MLIAPSPSPEQIDIGQLDGGSLVQTALNQIKGKSRLYRKYANFYGGSHNIAFASKKFREIFGGLFCDFSDNLCAGVVDTIAERLEITSFSIANRGVPEDVALSHIEHVTDVWDMNNMIVNAAQIHKEALTQGDAYVCVWPDEDGFPVIYPESSISVTVGYNAEHPNKLDWACKVWRPSRDYVRLNMYYPDVVVKYYSLTKNTGLPTQSNKYMLYEGDGDGGIVENPYGIVPIFHFSNNAGIGHWGFSELSNITNLQNALNKSLLDMLAAMEFVALPQRYAIGLEVDIDEDTGKPKVGFEPSVDRLWAVGSEGVEFGEFKAADLRQFLDVQDSLRTDIARISGVPLHYMMLMADPPSGAALETLEARFTKKLKQRQASFGVTWAQVLRFCHIVLGHPAEYRFKVKWVDPAPKSELEFVQTLQVKSNLGVSRKQILRELGYTEAQILTMEQERDDESDTPTGQPQQQEIDNAGSNPDEDSQGS